jgi:hypothetical protein
VNEFSRLIWSRWRDLRAGRGAENSAPSDQADPFTLGNLGGLNIQVTNTIAANIV